MINLEVGAGCGNFGKAYFHPCYLTDNAIKLIITDKCYIDCLCDAHKLPFRGNTFETIIMCNPYKYGFKEDDDAEMLLRELTRILKNAGEIIIICKHSNKYCTPKRVEKRIGELSLPGVSIRFQEEHINAKKLYRGYRFFMMKEMGMETIPNRRITLYVQK
ncbi:MAG: class I SAM-dependent methyltransferase [Gammaproteobacteria bacterium]|nr:class I SAM-dependent methyltransferase [Gammaproteobacteria bacterium]